MNPHAKTTVVDALLHRAASCTPEADEALLTLGLLLEHRSAGGDLTALLGPKLSQVRLTAQATDRVVRTLITLAMTPAPRTGVLWALQKSGDRQALPVFAHVLKHTLDDPTRQPLAEQALEGLLSFGDMALPEIRHAAMLGKGTVQAAATDAVGVIADGPVQR
jgi:hypothetical protein